MSQTIRPQIRPLVAIDLPGFGQSERRESLPN
jgi:pimeloyl-ACP methyl ester carboxylesterase